MFCFKGESMKKIFILLSLLWIGTGVLFSQEFATTDSGQRVELYDDGTWDVVVEQVDLVDEIIPEEEAVVSKWYSLVDIDPIDDSRVATYILAADSGKSAWGDTIYLIVRDTDGRFELFINWDDYLGSDVLVTHRVGTQPASTQSWNLSTDKNASFYPRKGSPSLESLLRAFTESDQFIARCTPYNESPITAIFDIRGFYQELVSNGSVLPF